jgi:hypothetical protein
VLRAPTTSTKLGYRKGEHSSTKSGAHVKHRKPTR